MDKIRIWFKNEWASKYIENVKEWEFISGYLKIRNNEGTYWIATDTIHYLIIGSMEEDFPYCPHCDRITDSGCVEACDLFKTLKEKEE